MIEVLSEQYKAGERAGRSWAEHQASPDELARLEAFHVECRNGGRWSQADWFEMERGAPWGAADTIAAAIMGFDEDNQLHAEAVEYAERLFGEGDEAPDDEFLCGFVCGALDVSPDA